jgi:streptogrisin C
MSISKKKGIIISVVTLLVVIAVAIAGYLYFSKNNSNKNDDSKVDTSALPNEMKKAIKDDLDMTPEQFMVQATTSAKLDNFQLDVSSDIKTDLAGVYIDDKGTPQINVTTKAAKDTLEKAKKATDTVPVDARAAVREAQQAIVTAQKNSSVLEVKAAVEKVKQKANDSSSVGTQAATQAIEDAKIAIDAAVNNVSSDDAKKSLSEAKVQLGSITAINIGSDVVKQAIGIAEQAINKAVSIGTAIATTALETAKKVLNVDLKVGGISSEKVTTAIGKVKTAVDNAIKNVASGDLIGLAVQGISDVIGIVSSIIDIPLNANINIVANSGTELDKTTEDTKKWVDGLPEQIKSQVIGVTQDIPGNNVNLILKQAKDIANQISLPKDIGNVSIVEVRTDLQVGLPTFSPSQIKGTTSAQPNNTSTPAPSASSEIPVRLPADGNFYGGSGYGVRGTSDDDFSSFTYCSAGFNGTDAQGKPIVFTAGHCELDIRQKQDKMGGSRATYRADGHGVVPKTITKTPAVEFIASKYQANPVLDVAIAKPLGDINKFKNAGVRTSKDGVVKITGTVNPVSGMPVCKFGQTTGFTCGRAFFGGISLPLSVPQVTQGWTSKMFLTNACVRGGDSGGPFISGTKAVGTLSGGPSAIIPGMATAPCTGNSLFDKLVGNWSLITPISEHLKAFPGTKVNTVSGS